MALSVRTIAAREELRFETVRMSAAYEGSAALNTATDTNAQAKPRKDILRVLSGSCETGGRELFCGHTYPLLPDRSYGIFTWGGCEVELDEGGFCTDVYTSGDTAQMAQIVKIHQNLEIWRTKAAADSKRETKGPRIALVGPPNCGKSTLVQTLLAYAVRDNRKPVFVDLDVAKSHIGVPGTIGATVCSSLSDMFSERGDVGFSARNPLLFFPGVENYTQDIGRIKDQTQLLANSIATLQKESPTASSDGVIVDTCGWNSNPSMRDACISLLRILSVNIIVVIGHDRLLSSMKDAFRDDPNVHAIVKVSRSDGIPERDANYVKRNASEITRRYFEGPRRELSPENLTLKIGTDVDIIVIRRAIVDDASLRPIGMEASSEITSKVAKLTVLDKTLEHSLLAISHASDENEVLSSSIAGVLHVISVDLAEQTITALSPHSGPLPSKFLIQGKVTYYESL